MSERRRPFRRGRSTRPSGNQSQTPLSESYSDVDPYLEPMEPTTPSPDAAQLPDARDNMTSPAIPSPAPNPAATPNAAPNSESSAPTSSPADSSPNGAGDGGGSATTTAGNRTTADWRRRTQAVAAADRGQQRQAIESESPPRRARQQSPQRTTRSQSARARKTAPAERTARRSAPRWRRPRRRPSADPRTRCAGGSGWRNNGLVRSTARWRIRSPRREQLPRRAGDAYVPTQRHAAVHAPPRRPGLRHHGTRSSPAHRRRRRQGDQWRQPGRGRSTSRFRFPHRFVSGAEAQARDGSPRQGRTRADAPRDRSDRADRLRAARAHRRPGPRRQDDAPPGNRRRRGDQPPPGRTARSAGRRAPRGSQRDDHVGLWRGCCLQLRHARGSTHGCHRDGARAGTPTRGAGQGCRHRSRFNYAHGARLQHR